MVSDAWVGLSGSGKTQGKNQWGTRLVLSDASKLNAMLQPRVNLLLVHDPPQTEYPDGQYARYWPGGADIPRFESFSQFLREPERRRRVCLITSESFPTEEAAAFALAVGSCAIDADEMDKVLPNDRKFKSDSSTHRMLQEGRKYNCFFRGTVRRLGAINNAARSNIQRVFIGPIFDPDDVRDAELALKIRPGRVPWDKLPQYHFIEGSIANPGDIYLTTFRAGQRFAVKIP